MTPASQPLGLISDVHGNLQALEAVLAEFGRRAIVDIFVAGDLILGGNEPLEVWKRLQQVHARCVSGPSDLALARVDGATLRGETPEEAEKVRRFIETQKSLGEIVLKRLAQLPKMLRTPMIDGREMLVVYGSPKDAFETIGHELDEEEMHEMLADDPADIVVCGGELVPWSRIVGDVQIINVGSVGESEGRVAHFTVLTPRMDGADFDQSWVEY